jgi:hypothetical protein
MANKVIQKDNAVVLRIDDVYTTNEKHFVTPYGEKNRYFGTIKFLNPKEAKATLKEAVKILTKQGVEDTVFEGDYPKWVEDSYGVSLQVGNKVKFFKSFNTEETVPDLAIRDFIYAVEIHLTPTTEKNQIFLRMPRAIALRASEPRYDDELFDEIDVTLDINEDDLPF